MKMRRLKLVAFVMTLAMVISTASAFACTGAYVGKDVSEDGTTIIARSEDQGTGAYAKMFKVQPRVTKAGRYYVDEGEDQKGFKVPLPKTPISILMCLMYPHMETENILQAAPTNMAWQS